MAVLRHFPILTVAFSMNFHHHTLKKEVLAAAESERYSAREGVYTAARIVPSCSLPSAPMQESPFEALARNASVAAQVERNLQNGIGGKDGKGVGAGDGGGNLRVKKISWWHQAIVDWQFENPGATLQDCAAYFNVTQAWLSTIRNSDAFKGYEMQRRQEHNANVSESVISKVEKLAALTVEVLHERIDAERDSIGLNGVKETADMALKALGFGVPRGGNNNANTQVNVNLVDASALARARETMRQVNAVNTLTHEGAPMQGIPNGTNRQLSQEVPTAK